MPIMKTLLKATLPVVSLLALSGCTLHFGGGTLGDTVRLMRAAWDSGDVRITYDQAASVPYASLGYRLGNSSERMLVLFGPTSPKNQLWTAGRQVALITRYNRITRTAGLPHNVDSLAPLKPGTTPTTDWFHDGHKIWQMVLGGEDGAIRLSCTHHDTGPDPVMVIGQRIAADRIEEHCVSQTPSVHWKFTNLYWVNRSTGQLWKSRQYIHPDMDPVTYEIFRQPAQN